MPRSEAEDLRHAAVGRWRDILVACGVPDEFLTGAQGPCPLCKDGTDRFVFDDKYGNGNYFCRQCGPGDGFTFVQKMNQIGFREAAEKIQQCVGTARVSNRLASAKSSRGDPRIIKRLWAESEPHHPAIALYLSSRGLSVQPKHNVRFHPGLYYYKRGKSKPVGKFPAIMARIQSLTGAGQSIHRTYLQADCRGKADVKPNRKLMRPLGDLAGCAIHLFEVQTVLGVAEGIETALAASELFHIPVWSVAGTALMESVELPTGLKKLVIFGDNDANYAGQSAAYNLAKRVVRDKQAAAVSVEIPPFPGDWLDVLVNQQKQVDMPKRY